LTQKKKTYAEMLAWLKEKGIVPTDEFALVNYIEQKEYVDVQFDGWVRIKGD